MNPIAGVVKTAIGYLLPAAKTDPRKLPLPFSSISWRRLISRRLYLLISITFTWHSASSRRLKEHNESASFFSSIPYVAVGCTEVTEHKFIVMILILLFYQKLTQSSVLSPASWI